METSAAAPAVEQSEPISQPVAQSEPAPSSVASADVHAVSASDEQAHAEAAELPQPAASAPAMSTDTIRLATELDEGGQCPEKSRVPLMADHPFAGKPSLLDPTHQQCAVSGCQFAQFAHPDSNEPAGNLAAQAYSKEFIAAAGKRLFPSFAKRADATASADADDSPTASLEDRIAQLEKNVAQLQRITR